MQFESFSFGSIQIDGIANEHDVVIDRGEVSKRETKPPRRFRDILHTPLFHRGADTLDMSGWSSARAPVLCR